MPRTLDIVDSKLASAPLDPDRFLRTVLRHLAGTLEDVIGLEDATGFIALVGQEIGLDLAAAYRAAVPAGSLDASTIGAVLVDLERRLGGEFSVEVEDEDRLVLENRSCPFGRDVVGRPSLCMLTSNVLGVVSAQLLGFSNVELERTIARGDARCRVVVHLAPRTGAFRNGGRAYFEIGS